jgi:hypothetical protein
MFNFILHPLQWQFDNDGQQVFRALELADGNYLVSFKMNNQTAEVLFTQEEVSHAMALNHWILTDKNGDF